MNKTRICENCTHFKLSQLAIEVDQYQEVGICELKVKQDIAEAVVLASDAPEDLGCKYWEDCYVDFS